MSGKKNYSDREFVKKYDELTNSNSSLILMALPVLTFFLFLQLYPIWFDSDNVRLTMYLISEGLVIIFCVLMHYRITSKKFMSEFGMDESRAQRRYDHIKKNGIPLEYLVLAQKICMLNPEARSLQLEQIMGWYVIDSFYNRNLLNDVTVINTFNLSPSLRSEQSCIQDLLVRPYSLNQTFVEKLFKLAVVEDGIHNDEWNTLMEIMKKLEFNKNYFEYFKKRYDPLRTEFEEGDPRNFTASREIPVSMLKQYYSILGLDENATDDEIKRAYHSLALQHHPDLPKNAGRVVEREEMMAKINEAYEKVRG
ncbi:MAG: DnaJ domain-containing protein [Paludibacteraceae bacterium]|nr:DnaJ domain-containing protein [Paludibacteraceae bacterium]